MANLNTCSFPGCGKPVHGRGLCGAHYAQMIRGGALKPLRGFGLTTEDRYWKSVVQADGCWGWNGHIENGYAQTGDTSGPNKWAHRVSWAIHNGPIPSGMQVDHICHTRECTRPDHLRLATSKQNNENPAGIRSDSTSGMRGVSYYKSRGKWRAHVTHHGKMHSLGYFDTPEEAHEVAKAKRIELFTHNVKDRAS